MITFTDFLEELTYDLVFDHSENYALRTVKVCRKFERLVYKNLGRVPSRIYREFYNLLIDFLYQQQDSSPLLNLNSHDKDIIRRNLDSAAEFLSDSIISEISSRF